jgi:CubicO group peptidase (beta-lactamase class C family)
MIHRSGRRGLLRSTALGSTALMLATATATATAQPASAATAPPVSAARPASAQSEVEMETAPPSVTPADIRFAHRTLRIGSPREVGLLPEQVGRMRDDAAAYLVPTPDHPRFPAYAGAAALAAKDGVVVQRFALGTAVRYRAVGAPPDRVGVELPAEEQIPTREDTIFDLASVSKLFTTIAVLQQVEAGRIDLDAPVARYVPEFAANGKDAVTVRHLLTHTAGLPAFLPLWSTYPTPEQRLAAALATPFAAGAAPGNQYVYSDLGLIALGMLVERAAGDPLDEVVRTRITSPLSMVDTGFNPAPDRRRRIAATEYQPYAGRGMVWGEVHDENAWALGGVAGHAGIFSTVDDLAILCQTLLNGGAYRGRRILRESTVRAMLVNYNADLESRFPDSDRGLGFELAKHSYMDALASPVTFGHTGFTGTSVVVDPLSHSFVILLSNRVHPDRGWGTNTVSRRALARDFADAAPVRAPLGGPALRAQRRDSATVSLVAPLRVPATRAAAAAFLLWYDTEPRYDVVRIETSADGGTTWTPATMTLRSATRRWRADGTLTGYGGRRWWRVSSMLPAGTTHLRWTYTTDVSAQGRGVYVDRVLVIDPRTPGAVLFAGGGAHPGRFVADGWAPSTT